MNWYRRPGYKNLLVYKLAVIIFNLNDKFCSRFINKRSRTFDQMIQASRSGKQNIVEGSLEKSLKGYIKLLGVSRASYGELKEDYIDFLRLKGLSLWNKDDLKVKELRKIRVGEGTDLANLPNWANLSNIIKNPEVFANLMITLITLECYLLDKLTKSLEDKFTREGGYTENLFKKRLSYRKKIS